MVYTFGCHVWKLVCSLQTRVPDSLSVVKVTVGDDIYAGIGSVEGLPSFRSYR